LADRGLNKNGPGRIVLFISKIISNVAARGTAEQWIKEGKQAVKMARLSCHIFRCNGVRLALGLLLTTWTPVAAAGATNANRELVAHEFTATTALEPPKGYIVLACCVAVGS
jgi:hypothetical protein